MIYFFVGLISGAVGACIACYVMGKGKTHAEPETKNTAAQDRSEREKRERAELLKELERQFDNMMAYTGKEQKKACKS